MDFLTSLLLKTISQYHFEIFFIRLYVYSFLTELRCNLRKYIKDHSGGYLIISVIWFLVLWVIPPKRENFIPKKPSDKSLIHSSMITVVPNRESTKPHLYNKFPLFKISWWMIRVHYGVKCVILVQWG